jgi:predicted 3-demethylubiquinone-9 3-methyltransferase (glyoxalase superfamily)
MCGWLKDKFGVSWQVMPTELMSLLRDPDPGRAQRATEAMLSMRRIDLAEIKRAADQVSV